MPDLFIVSAVLRLVKISCILVGLISAIVSLFPLTEKRKYLLRGIAVLSIFIYPLTDFTEEAARQFYNNPARLKKLCDEFRGARQQFFEAANSANHCETDSDCRNYSYVWCGWIPINKNEENKLKDFLQRVSLAKSRCLNGMVVEGGSCALNRGQVELSCYGGKCVGAYDVSLPIKLSGDSCCSGFYFD